MKRIQRFFAVTFAMILLMCGFTATVGAADPMYAEAAKMLSALQISTPDTDGTPALNATAQKYQVTVLFAEAMTGKTDLAFWNTPAQSGMFTDVPAYGGAIDYMAKRGIVSGTGDTVYGYTDSVSYQQLITVAIRVLGYETEDMVFPQDHIFAAERLGLLDNLAIDSYTKTVTYGETMQLLWNTLCTEVAVYDPMSGELLYPGEAGMTEITTGPLERVTLLESNGFVAGAAEEFVVSFIEADEDNEMSVDMVELRNGWYIAAADIGITADTPKVSYLGLPVTIWFDCMEEDFELLYDRGEASILAYDFAEYTLVTNLGGETNIRYDLGQEKLFLGEDSFSFYDSKFVIYFFGETGWMQLADPLPVLESFAYDYGYVGTPDIANTYGQMAYRVSTYWSEDTWEEQQLIEILYTPYQFARYIERELTYAPTGTEGTFTILGHYAGTDWENLDEERTYFTEYFLGTATKVTSSTVSKRNGEASLTVTVEGADISSGDFMFYSYNPVDNVLMVAENWGALQTGRMTASSASQETVKIDSVNYTCGFDGLYPALTPYNKMQIDAIIMNMVAGEDNVQYVAKENCLAFYAPLAVAAEQENDGFAIVSFDPELMADLLGITVTRYNNALIGAASTAEASFDGGFYVDDGYILAAFLNTENGKWHLGYIEEVALTFDEEEGEFTDFVDVPTMAKYVEITSTINGLAEYIEAANLLTSNAMHLVCSNENGAYTLADIDTMYTYGEYLIPRCENALGLVFNSAGRTNMITADPYFDAARVTTGDDTVIVAIDSETVGVRTGAQVAKASINENVVFYAASDALIVLTTDATLGNWGDAYQTEASVPPSADTPAEPEQTITPVTVEEPFAIVSFDAAILADLLGISEAKYNDALVDGFYITGEYVTVAVLDTVAGQWGIGYIEAVAQNYDTTEGDFLSYIDVATMARYTQITDNLNNKEAYDAAKEMLWSNALHMVVSVEDGVYTLADIYTMGADETHLVDYCKMADGLVFDEAGVTNPIKATSLADVDAQRITTKAGTVLVGVDCYGNIYVRAGVQTPKQSVEGTAEFFAADESLIVFVTEAELWGWAGSSSASTEETYFFVLPDFSVEIEMLSDIEYSLTVEGLLDLRTFTVAEPLVIVGEMGMLYDLCMICVGELLYLSEDGELIVTGQSLADAMAAIRGDDWFIAEVVEFADSESITVKSGGIEITNAAFALTSIDAQVVTLDLTEVNWDHYDLENLYVPVPYEPDVYDSVVVISVNDNDYFQYPLDESEREVWIHEPTRGVFSQFEADMAGKEVRCLNSWDESFPMFVPELYTIACYDEDSEKLQLCVLKLLIPMDAPACVFGNWVQYNAASHARICSCGMVELAKHTYGDWTETVAATAESTGVKVRTCTTCGQKQSAEIPMLDVTILSVDAPVGRVGNTVNVDVAVRNDKGFGGLEFAVGFDTELLTLTAIELADAFGGFTATPVEIAAESGTVAFCFADTSNNMSGGTIATLSFMIPEGTAECETPITLTYTEGAAFYYDGQNMVDLALQTENGLMRIYDYLPGDVNGDDKVNIRDAAMILQSIAYWGVEVRDIVADVNCDGKVNIRDVAMILQYLAGWDVVLGEEPVAVELMEVLAAQSMNITVTSTEAAPGDTFSVDVAIAENSGFAGLDFSLCFDNTMLTLVSVNQEDALDAFTVTPVENANEKGEIIFCYVDLANICSDGKIATLTFKVDPSAAGKNLLLAVMPPRDAFGISGSQFIDIIVFTESGTVTVTVPFGDINGNGTLGIEDVLLVLKAILNDTELANGDMNSDGKITLIDVMRLLRVIAG